MNPVLGELGHGDAELSASGFSISLSFFLMTTLLPPFGHTTWPVGSYFPKLGMEPVP